MIHGNRKTILRLLVVLFAIAFIFALGFSFASCSKGVADQDDIFVRGEQESQGDVGDGFDIEAGEDRGERDGFDYETDDDDDPDVEDDESDEDPEGNPDETDGDDDDPDVEDDEVEDDESDEDPEGNPDETDGDDDDPDVEDDEVEDDEPDEDPEGNPDETDGDDDDDPDEDVGDNPETDDEPDEDPEGNPDETDGDDDDADVEEDDESDGDPEGNPDETDEDDDDADVEEDDEPDEDPDDVRFDYVVGDVSLSEDGAYLIFVSDDEDETVIGRIAVSALLGDVEPGSDETVVGMGFEANKDEDGRTRYTVTIVIYGVDGSLSDAYGLDVTNLVDAVMKAVDSGSGSDGHFSLSDGVVTAVSSRTQDDGEITIAVTFWYGETCETVIPAATQIGTSIEDVRINGNIVEIKYSNKDGYEALFDLETGSSKDAASLGINVGILDGCIVIYTGDDSGDASSWITSVDASVFEADLGGEDGMDGDAEGVVYVVGCEMCAAVYDGDEPGETLTRYYLVLTYSDGSADTIYMYYTSSKTGGVIYTPTIKTVCVDHQWSGYADTKLVSGEASCLEGYWMAESCTICGTIRTDDMSNWAWVPSDGHAWMWSDDTYYELVRKTNADGTTAILFLPEDGLYVITGYCSVCGTYATVTFTLEDAMGYSGGDSAWNEANEGLAELFDKYGFTFEIDYPSVDGGWDCTTGAASSFTLTIGGTQLPVFDYWYSEDGMHVTKSAGEFLGEEDTYFTEIAVSSLDLYFELDGDGTKVEYVYFFDEAYGTVYIYGVDGESDRINYYDGLNGNLLGTNVWYDLSGIFTFYDSSYDADKTKDSEKRFKALKESVCEDGPVAVGYFVCSCCGTKAEIYATKAHSFASTGGYGITTDRPSQEKIRTGMEWADADCSSAASHINECLACGVEVTVYGQGKTGHEYSCSVDVDENENTVRICAECGRDGCGSVMEATYTLYVEYDGDNPLYDGAEDLYHMRSNPLTGRAYFELCGTVGCCETHFVMNAEDGLSGYLTVERYAEDDVAYDASTGEWTVSGRPGGEITCADGAYDVYTLDGAYVENVLGGRLASDGDGNEASCCWYIEPSGNELKLLYPYEGGYTYTVYAAQTFGVNGSSYPNYDFANYVYADGSDFKAYVRAEQGEDGDMRIVEAYFYDLDGTKLYMDTDYIYEIQLGRLSCSEGTATWMTVYCSCGACDGKAGDGAMSMIVNVAEVYTPHSFGAEADFLLADGTFDYETYLKAVEEQRKYEESLGGYETEWPEGIPSVEEWLAFTIDREPTCAQTGSAFIKCTSCGKTYYYDINRSAHEYEAEYDPATGRIILVCANAEECGMTGTVEVDAQFVRYEEATCTEPAKAVYVGYLEETNTFYEVSYVLGSVYGSHSVNGVSLECADAGRGFDETCDTVYYLETYADGKNEYSRVYVLGDDGEYVLVYDTGDEDGPLYGETDGIIKISDTYGVNCAPISDSNPVMVSGSFVCSVCGRTCYVWLKTMHTAPDEGSRTKDNYNVVGNTCTEYGYTEYRCADCGELIRVYNDGYTAGVTGHVFSDDSCMVVISQDYTYATAYYLCENCGYVAAEVLSLTDAVYVGKTETYVGDADAQYWGTFADCTSAGELHYVFKVRIWTGIYGEDGKPVYREASVTFTVRSSATGHSWSGESYLGVAYDGGTFHYMESYTCAVCGQLVVDSCPIYVYDEDTAYDASGLGKTGDTTQPYAYYLELAGQISSGEVAYVFSVNYDSFSSYDGDEHGTVYYLGYKFTYIYTADGKTYGPYTVMFVVMAGDSEYGLEDLVLHKSMHQKHEEDLCWGALERDSDGNVLLFLWVEDDGTAIYYGMCRYDGDFVTLFVLDERDDESLEGMGCLIVNKDTV